jgi:cyanate permease
MMHDYQATRREENQLLLWVAVSFVVLCCICGVAIGALIEYIWIGFAIGLVFGMVLVAFLWIAKSLQQASEATGDSGRKDRSV